MPSARSLRTAQGTTVHRIEEVVEISGMPVYSAVLRHRSCIDAQNGMMSSSCHLSLGALVLQFSTLGKISVELMSPLLMQVLTQTASFGKTLYTTTRMSAGSSQTQKGIATAEAEATATSAPVPTDERVEALRAEMAKENVEAYIIPTEDPHMVQPSSTSQETAHLHFKSIKL